ncbi:hypothetical protein BS47DRAFT_1288438, partial [Hydnum rufescens UP504]
SMELGLERASALFGLLSYTRPTIHVAGTNGKGSVTTLIEHVLIASGLSIGKFTSPHFIDVHDCISINGVPLSPTIYAKHQDRVKRFSDDHQIGATNFELLTACALSAFEDAAVQVVVLEVGMGGRLDATNALPDERMLISAIASISLDHQTFLGSSISEIAHEKAGIIRQGGIVVLGDQTPMSEEDVLRSVAASATERDARLVRSRPLVVRPWLDEFDGTKLPWDIENIDEQPSLHHPIMISSFNDDGTGKTLPGRLRLAGEHQLSNAGLAYTVLATLRASKPSLFGHLTDQHVVDGFSNARWPGRLSWITVSLPLSRFREYPVDCEAVSPSQRLSLLVDGAHNAGSAQALSAYLSTLPMFNEPPRTFILALSFSPPKRPVDVLGELLRPRDRVALVQFGPVEGMPWVSNVPHDEMKRVARNLIGPSGEIWEAPDADVSAMEQSRVLHDALQWARSKGSFGILAGSLYLVSDLYRLLRTCE